MNMDNYLKHVKTVVSQRMANFKEYPPDQTLWQMDASCEIAGASGARIVSMCNDKWRWICDVGP